MLFSWYAGGAEPELVTLGILTYNIIAFGSQPLIGYLCDTYRKIPIAIIGCLLLITGLFSLPLPWASVFLMGLGNACFHIGGGTDSLRHAKGRMARSGVFVSSGALGVALGTLAGKSGSVPMPAPIGALVLCLILLFLFCPSHKELPDSDKPFTLARPELRFWVVILLASISIMVRSYAGSVLPLEWRTTTALFLIPAIGAFLGKASGGYLADRIGSRRVAVTSLSLAVIILTFGFTNPWFYIAGIILFNMNMSITLCVIASVLTANPGLAFGITTLALLCGNVPTFFIAVPQAPLVFALLTIVSIACLYYMLKGKKEEQEGR
ncbi:MAG: MFS transporter [Coriobacteriia bacterium]|nr:MFS transporter [Coriobacteriia bacterium]